MGHFCPVCSIFRIQIRIGSGSDRFESVLFLVLIFLELNRSFFSLLVSLPLIFWIWLLKLKKLIILDCDHCGLHLHPPWWWRLPNSLTTSSRPSSPSWSCPTSATAPSSATTGTASSTTRTTMFGACTASASWRKRRCDRNCSPQFPPTRLNSAPSTTPGIQTIARETFTWSRMDSRCIAIRSRRARTERGGRSVSGAGDTRGRSSGRGRWAPSPSSALRRRRRKISATAMWRCWGQTIRDAIYCKLFSIIFFYYLFLLILNITAINNKV